SRFPGEHLEAEEGLGPAECLRRALDRVRTPYLLDWEHDWELNRPIDTEATLRALRDHPAIRTIRLNERVTLEAAGDLELLQRSPEAPVPLVATPCWPTGPHFARTETYRSLLPAGVDGRPPGERLGEEALRA